ncbi:hypothetical protein LCGC14_0527120 [marine sediment metagenome]|uniref:Bacteriophage Mu GpT domain-containing protein n=1 Tax=marine sediment metagenome TaxID=412755 RepID=A0A0F9V4W9_9ZZZZ
MASSGGHWKTLAEAQKLTQSHKIPGVFEEDIKRNNPVERMPVAQAAGTGLKIEWLRENTTTESAVVEAAIGDQLSWGEDVEYTEVESTLRYMYIQRKLDRYVQNIYGTYNDYRAQALLESEKGLKRRIGDRIIYADTTYGGTPTQFDGIHALVAERGTPNSASVVANSDLNLDQEDAGLSLALLRRLIDAMVFGCDEIWVPKQIGIRIDAVYGEQGFYTALSNGFSHGDISLLTRSMNDIGKPIMFFMGIPIVRMDYLVDEESNTGTGATSNARAKYSSDRTYSIFGVRFGNVLAREPGITFAYGGTEGEGDLYELWTWDRLEDFNAGGMRLDSYGTVLLGSTKCCSRIHDVDNSRVTV